MLNVYQRGTFQKKQIEQGNFNRSAIIFLILINKLYTGSF